MAIAATPYSNASIRRPSVLNAFRSGWKGRNPAHQPPKRCPAPPPGTGVGRPTRGPGGSLRSHFLPGGGIHFPGKCLKGCRARKLPSRLPPIRAMSEPLAPSPLLMPMFSSAAMRPIVDDRARLQRMLDFEAALARAEAAVGAIPQEVIDAIAAAAKIARFERAAL